MTVCASRPNEGEVTQHRDAILTEEHLVVENDRSVTGRPEVRGKAIYHGGVKLFVRGATYGTFGSGNGFPSPETVEADLAAMARAGATALRTYTLPPRWLLDAAGRHDLLVLVGLPWEQHVAFLDDRAIARRVERQIRSDVASCAGHPALLGFAVGNEIPSSIVRWHGRRRVERFLERLHRGAKTEDPDAIVTYVNYPSAEYLQLDFLDFACFNVFLERETDLAAYVARLQNIAGDRPLVLGEIGLDSRRHGLGRQAELVEGGIAISFEAGCAGAFVFAWTDDWHRSGHEVTDWDFGLVTRDRRPKPALAAATRAWRPEALPIRPRAIWPSVSVILCSHNGAATIGECLIGLSALDYPSYEVIVVDDGSTDGTGRIAEGYGARVIRTGNEGLSSARNTGWRAAAGSIVAFIDDDAAPDPHWLRHLATALETTNHVGVGGPNLPPGGDGLVADCVASAPGGPVHVLLADDVAEHIPGCNMAFRRDSLHAIDGFDPQFRVAGDDVDVCWRLQGAGGTLGFSAGAVVWHHRRRSIRSYLRQQWGYGKAEALLERKWPERYNRGGHLTWAGRVYGAGAGDAPWHRWHIYYGTWGTEAFQSAIPAPAFLGALAQTPEAWPVVLALGLVSALGAAWSPLLWALPLFTLGAGALLVGAAAGGQRARSVAGRRGAAGRSLQAGTTLLFVLQPLARLAGRIGHGLAPWRRRVTDGPALPWPRTTALWNQCWRAQEAHLAQAERSLLSVGGTVVRGGPGERWDLETRGGALGAARLRIAVEEHGHGRQLLRVRRWPVPSCGALALASLFGSLAAFCVVDDGPWAIASVLAAVGVLLFLWTARDCAVSVALLDAAAAAMLEAPQPARTGRGAAPAPPPPQPAGSASNGRATAAASAAPTVRVRTFAPPERREERA